MIDATETRRRTDTPQDPTGSPEGGRPDLRWLVDRLIAAIDRALSEQVNAILHHPEFQRLEASWRSVKYLADAAHGIDQTRVRVLSVSWRELARDLTRAAEYDQSQMFDKIYNQEFGMPGVEPFGLLIGDYEISPLPAIRRPASAERAVSTDRRADGNPVVGDLLRTLTTRALADSPVNRPGKSGNATDAGPPPGQPDAIAVLREMAKVAAAAFAPFLCNAAPAMFGLDHFQDLGAQIDLARTFRQTEYQRWREFQQNPTTNEDLRFIGLTLPHILIREPWPDDGSRADGFRFRETVDRDGRDGYLWSSAAYAFASVVLRAFGDCGWFTEIRGTRRDVLGCGLVVDLPVPSFATDRRGVAIKLSSDVEISDRQERELSELGFIPLGKARYTDYSVFFGNQSIQTPQKFEDAAATVNARLSSMMQYLLCVSRFAHYIKVMCRDRLGSFSTPADAEEFLNRWLANHCANTENAEVMTRYPLRQGTAEIRESPGRPGLYSCRLWLQPHFQLDEISAGFRLVTEVASGQAA